jgi:hypothetical protein
MEQQTFLHLEFVRWIGLAAADANIRAGLNVDRVLDVSKIECPSLYAVARPDHAIEYLMAKDNHS